MTDAAAVTMGPATPINLTLQLERSFDGGRRWIACNLRLTSLMRANARWPALEQGLAR